MYSPEGSSGDPVNSREQAQKWMMGTSCNISKEQDQIDWAALAQQWIQMRESCNDTSFLTAPPPPRISGNDLEEKGEAPMEVVREEELITSQDAVTNNVGAIYQNHNRQDWQATSWFGQQCHWRAGWETWAQPTALPITSLDMSVPPMQPIDLIKDPSHFKCGTETDVQTQMNSTMDAAKRKALPAWIREGLEKMEREKQKHLEKEKEVQLDLLSKSSNNTHTNVDKRLPIVVTSKLFQDNNDSDEEQDDRNSVENDTKSEVSKIVKSKEELFEEMMLVVRKALTEILLEVTNEEILSVAQETLRRSKTKASSAQVFRKSAISSITGKLGLGAYADSASENSDSEDGSVADDNDYDSEEEIKESIRIRQTAFKAIAQEIELRVNETAERDQRRNIDKVSETLEKVCDKDIGETQPGKKINSNGKRSRERTSRFSDAKDSKYKSSAYIMQSSLPSSSNEFEKKKTNFVVKQHSYSSDSSSDSYDTYRSSKRRTSRERNYKASASSSYSKRERERSRVSSDSDEKSRTRHRSSYSKEKSRSRSRSRSRSYTGRRYEQLY